MTCCNSSHTPSFPLPHNQPHLPFPLPPASPRRARPLLSRALSALVACPTLPPISLSRLLSPLSRPFSTQSAPSPSSSSPPLLFPPSSPFPLPLSSSHMLISAHPSPLPPSAPASPPSPSPPPSATLPSSTFSSSHPLHDLCNVQLCSL
ncbi:unnamed protein product [Closterium sp. Naga37s-1]|nr:unnamed protein product [Closterium sp. Naga37s-1]